jgi:hypothetical protein
MIAFLLITLDTDILPHRLVLTQYGYLTSSTAQVRSHNKLIGLYELYMTWRTSESLSCIIQYFKRYNEIVDRKKKLYSHST